MAEFIFGLLIGLAVARVFGFSFAQWNISARFAHIKARLLSALASREAPAPAPQAAISSDAQPSAGINAEPLAAHLRRLETAFLPIADNAAHPREFADQPTFQEAADLLAADTVSLKTVMQYVFGANWALCCAALAGLAKRPDRLDATDQIVAGFDRLTPWAMHYGFAYFLTLPARPPLAQHPR